MSVLVCDSNGELWHTRAKELGLDYGSYPSARTFTFTVKLGF